MERTEFGMRHIVTGTGLWPIRPLLTHDTKKRGKKNILIYTDSMPSCHRPGAAGGLQKQSQGFATPHTFTHGGSRQRVKWFAKGVKNGQPSDCDTFGE